MRLFCVKDYVVNSAIVNAYFLVDRIGLGKIGCIIARCGIIALFGVIVV